MELENEVIDGNSFLSTTEIKEYLLETAKWGKFLSILGYIGMGLMVIGGLFAAFTFRGEQKFLALAYIVFGVIYYFPTSFLYKFSVKMKDGLSYSNDPNAVTEGFANLKSLFKFMGIMAIVILSIYALALVGVLIFAAALR